MGKRVTRAAEHVSAEVIQQRMRAETSPWRRRHWHIIWLALTAPRQAEEIARQAGVSPATVHRALARYRHGWRWRETSVQPAQAPPGVAEMAAEPQERPSAPVADRQRQPLPAGSPHALQRYPSDLTDREWALLEPLLPPAKPDGRPRTTDLREVLNALFYLDRTGAQWRALPKDLPPWSTVWTYFRQWRNNGTWERIHTALREQVRLAGGREPTPSAAIIDSQSVKTSQKGGGAAMMAARRSRGASATCWSIRWA